MRKKNHLLLLLHFLLGSITASSLYITLLPLLFIRRLLLSGIILEIKVYWGMIEVPQEITKDFTNFLR